MTTISLYPKVQQDNVPKPAFGNQIDNTCREIHESCKEGWGSDGKKNRLVKAIGKGAGLGVDEEKLIKAIGNTVPEDRYKICRRYKEMFNEDLETELRNDCAGHFGEALQLLAVSPAVAESRIIHKACKGLGTDETLLYSVICGRSNVDMDCLKKAFFQTYQKDLGKLMIKELSGDIEKLIFCCMQASEETFDPKYHTKDRASKDADELKKMAVEKKWFGASSSERAVFTIICNAPPAYLKLINDQYKLKQGVNLVHTIYKGANMGRTAKKAALFHLGMKMKPYETVAKMIKHACAGLGTDELLLTSCIIRYQDVVKEVQLAHIELFEKSIQDRVKSEVSGCYKNLLLTLLNKAFPDD